MNVGIIERTAEVFSARKRPKADDLARLRKEAQARLESIESRLKILQRERPNALERGTAADLRKIDAERAELEAEESQLRARKSALYDELKAARASEAIANARELQRRLRDDVAEVERLRAELAAANIRLANQVSELRQNQKNARETGFDPGKLLLDGATAERVAVAVHGDGSDLATRQSRARLKSELIKGA